MFFWFSQWIHVQVWLLSRWRQFTTASEMRAANSDSWGRGQTAIKHKTTVYLKNIITCQCLHICCRYCAPIYIYKECRKFCKDGNPCSRRGSADSWHFYLCKWNDSIGHWLFMFSSYKVQISLQTLWHDTAVWRISPWDEPHFIWSLQFYLQYSWASFIWPNAWLSKPQDSLEEACTKER